MKLIFAPAHLQCGDRFSPSKTDQRHLLKVLRLQRGDEVEGSDGAVRYRCKVVRANSKVELEVATAETMEDSRRIALALARIEPARFEFAVSAAAQLSVKEIIAFGCARQDPGKLRMDRLRRVAVESAKQTGCPFLPSLSELPDVPSLAACVQDTYALLLDHGARLSLMDALTERVDPSAVFLIVGPPGDLTEEEKQSLRNAGAVPARLGAELLRSETAAVVAMGVAAVTLARTART
ncbi:MAG: hypothetical protein A3G34_14790 [Candidatus Lindowbacteria bacterium RIFCSPLOWO2_12_FULL_62_27]|nr:MAG: hypothetical protein A3I06_10070 [Candidatus Lindowbacteria bacterium RIFCSPLOWO2_02_FULL_62_12]OGH63123.1 MAG: hypothetical protein A3G34_14790 [Candidatus Lindowbacteria bacterium RIFCSPLOWO2_12_FULL_62_27]